MEESPLDIKPLRIATLCLHSSPLGPLGTRDTGGMSVYVREVARWMAHTGHVVDIFTYTPCLKECTHLYPNVRLIDLNPHGQKEISKEGLVHHLPEVVHVLEQFVQRHQLTYDVIHSHYWLSGQVGHKVQKSWGCPHVITFHTLGLIKNRTTAGEAEPDLRITHERRLAQAVDAIVVPSDGEHSNLLNQYGAPSHKLYVIPCGVNMERFKPMQKRHARAQLKIDPAASVILFVGRFAPVKGMDVLLKAMARLAPRIASLKLIVVGGDGPHAQTTLAIKRQAEGLGIAPLLNMAGRVEHDQLPIYYNAADLLAVPSTYESFGLVTLESLACGSPVATTRVGGAAAIIKEGVNGTLLEDSGATAVARGLERVLMQVQRRRVSAQQIRGSVVEYGWDRVAASILNMYNKFSGTMQPNLRTRPRGSTVPFPF
jgi:D-inositol-3-phosphate glycosyltransferase